MRRHKQDFLRVMHIINHLLVAGGLYYMFSSQWLLVSVFAWFLYGCLGISIGYHRYLAHRSYVAQTPALTNLFILLGCFATGGSPITWAGSHRLHHTHPDKPGDPHSMLNDGALRIYTHLWKPFTLKRKHVRDLLSDPFLRFLHHYYELVVLSWALLLLLIDTKMLIYFYALPSVFAFHAFGLINTLGHYHGYRTYNVNDQSTNSWIANILTWGEGWHNNHHKFPASHRIGLLPYELDIGAYVIEYLPGLAKHRTRLTHRKTRLRNTGEQN